MKYRALLTFIAHRLTALTGYNVGVALIGESEQPGDGDTAPFDFMLRLTESSLHVLASNPQRIDALIARHSGAIVSTFRDAALREAQTAGAL